MRDDMDERSETYLGPLDLPDQHDGVPDADEGSGAPSLMDELGDLFEDGKTYVEAEFTYQKSRASYAADQGKGALLYGLAALAFVHLALIALAVGLVLALIPVVGPWGATGIVAGLLLVGAAYFGLKVKARLGAISEAFSE